MRDKVTIVLLITDRVCNKKMSVACMRFAFSKLVLIISFFFSFLLSVAEKAYAEVSVY